MAVVVMKELINQASSSLLTNSTKEAFPQVVSETMNQVKSMTQKSSSVSQHSQSQMSTEHLKWLWKNLTSLYGQLFTNKHGLQDNGTWLKVLGDLTPKALESGMERLRRVKGDSQFCNYPPNPLQFRALCLAYYEEQKLPGVGAAFDEIRQKASYGFVGWSHPVVKYTASKLTQEFLKIEDVNKAFTLFCPIYEKVCNLVKQGHQLPDIGTKVFYVKGSNKEIARAHLSQMKQLLGGKQ